jgi:hypothetical protein
MILSVSFLNTINKGIKYLPQKFVNILQAIKNSILNYLHTDHTILGKKGKAIPLQALTGPEGSTRLRLPDFKTIGI